tara:strand:+ start:22726 stop:23088 length:363 start_codon:yes stop_codon:yes gene_type:complete
MERNKDDNRQTEPKQPADVIRDGNLKASIWRNEGESGPFYATSFARTYQDRDGNARDTNSFVGSDLLKLSELARAVYTRTSELRHEEKPNRDEQEPARRAEFKQQRSAEAQEKKSRDQQR